MRLSSLLVISYLTSTLRCHPTTQNNTLTTGPLHDANHTRRALLEIQRIRFHGCTPAQISILRSTVSNTFAILDDMSTAFHASNPYVRAFWPADSLSDSWMAYGREYYARMAAKLRVNNDNANKFTFACGRASVDFCREGGAVAYAIAERNEIGFCDVFFEKFGGVDGLKCVEGRGLGLYDARERALTHELAHTRLAPKNEEGKYPSFPRYEGPATDIKNPRGAEAAYGVALAHKLAVGKLWGLPAQEARMNAENWAMIAWGKTIRKKCRAETGKKTFDIPIA